MRPGSLLSLAFETLKASRKPFFLDLSFKSKFSSRGRGFKHGFQSGAYFFFKQKRKSLATKLGQKTRFGQKNPMCLRFSFTCAFYACVFEGCERNVRKSKLTQSRRDRSPQCLATFCLNNEIPSI